MIKKSTCGQLASLCILCKYLHNVRLAIRQKIDFFQVCAVILHSTTRTTLYYSRILWTVASSSILRIGTTFLKKPRIWSRNCWSSIRANDWLPLRPSSTTGSIWPSIEAWNCTQNLLARWKSTIVFVDRRSVLQCPTPIAHQFVIHRHNATVNSPFNALFSPENWRRAISKPREHYVKNSWIWMPSKKPTPNNPFLYYRRNELYARCWLI